MFEFPFPILLVFCCTATAEATDCYECRDIPHLRDCSIVRKCNPHEECYVEQIVTTSGHIVFNSGCRDRQDCARFSGRTASDIENDQSYVSTESDTLVVNLVRRSDISVCEQCCDTDYCNNKGCFDIATPQNQRGLYCFSCKRQSEQESCRHVTQCNQDQVCFIEKLLDSGMTVYDSHCIEKLQCDSIKNTYQQFTGKRSRDAKSQLRSFVDLVKSRDTTRIALCLQCCDTDFCNKNCIQNT